MTYPKIRLMAAEILGTSQTDLRPETRLDALGSIGLAQLVIRAERTFKVTIYDDEASGFVRLCDVAEHVDNLIEAGQDDYAPPTDDARARWYFE